MRQTWVNQPLEIKRNIQCSDKNIPLLLTLWGSSDSAGMEMWYGNGHLLLALSFTRCSSFEIFCCTQWSESVKENFTCCVLLSSWEANRGRDISLTDRTECTETFATIIFLKYLWLSSSYSYQTKAKKHEAYWKILHNLSALFREWV